MKEHRELQTLIDELERHIVAQAAEINRLQIDANRYRWLRKYTGQMFMATEKQVDVEVDRAMFGGVLKQNPCKCIDKSWCATFDRCKLNDTL
jgi:hypothetical protein